MHYLIDFKNDTAQGDIDAYFVTHGLTVLKTFNQFEKVYHVEAQAEPAKTDIIEFIVRDDDSPLQLLNTVIVADQNYGKIVTDGSVPTIDITNNDQNWWKYYTISDPDLDATTMTINRRGSNTTVYLLDSGVNLLHPEFSDAQVTNLWSFTGNFNDTNGHGTAIASVICGKTCGVTNATVKSVKIFEQNVPTRQSDLLTALDVIYDDFVQNNYNSRHGDAIVNMSWSVAKNEYIESKIRSMLSSGIFFVTSAGNDGSPISDRTPASMPEVLTIGAYNNNLLPCDFSNYTGDSAISLSGGNVNHGALDGWAPGEKIYAATIDGSYGFVAGTSIAAGITSAVIAYNLDLVLEPIYSTNLLTYFSSFALFRQDLLDLSDPKYADSANGMITLRERMPPSFGRSNPIQYQMKGISGRKMTAQFFSPWQIKQVEFLGDIPAGFEVTPIGKMFGIYPTLNDDEKYRLLSVPLKVTYLDGFEETNDFNIYVTHPEFNVGTESTGDPEVDIVLAQQVFCVSFGTQCISPLDSCFDSCSMILVCDNGICPNPKQISCVCIL